MVADRFEQNVFINCPLDSEYERLLRPLLFTVISLGFDPRLAAERSDALEVRIDKIRNLIRESKYSIHDLSRLKSKEVDEFFRMNMPFELGLDYGARMFGSGRIRRKKCLILEAARYDFMKALSDLSGVDIKAHANEPEKVIKATRDWFVETAGLTRVPSPTRMWYDFTDFAKYFYDSRKAEGFSDDDLNMMPVAEYSAFIREWIS